MLIKLLSLGYLPAIGTRRSAKLRLALITSAIAALVACGGGGSSGGGSAPADPTNAAPTSPTLIEVSSLGTGSLTASWIPATDDRTASNQIRYQVHASTIPSFSPDASTLVYEGLGLASASISSGLAPGATYHVRVLAFDEGGSSSRSDLRSLRISDQSPVLLGGVSPRLVDASSLIASTSNSLTFAPGSSTPGLGQILTSTQGDGFLRTVTAINGNVVQTRPTSLNEVFSDFRATSSIGLSTAPDRTTSSRDSARPNIQVARSAQGMKITWPDSRLSVSHVRASQTPRLSGRPRTLGATSVRERPLATSGSNISASTTLADGSAGSWTTFSAPHTVAIIGGTKGTFTVDAVVTADDQKYWDRGALIPISLCEARITQPAPPLVASVLSTVATESQTTQFRDFSVTYDRHQVHTIEVDATGLEARAEPYQLELTLYVDEAENRCRNFNGRGLLGWKEKVVVTIDVVVASTPNFPQGESRSLDFDGDFRVNNRMTLTFDPILETDIDLSLARLRSARVEVKGRTSLDQVLTITADGAGALDKTHEIVPERKFIKVFLAGGVPVVISGQYSVDLRVQGNATGQIQATESVSLALEDMTYGLRFEGGTWSTTGQMRAVQSLKLVGEAQAEANLTLTLLPKVSISLYEVATARVALAPSLTAEGAIRGRVVEELVNTAATTDADAWLEKARLVTAIDAFVMAEFGAFDATLLTWPSGARAADYQTFQKIEVLTPQPILGIPILTAVADFSAKHPLDSSAILIRGTATNVPNPFRSLWGPDAFVEFSAWTVPRVIAANNEGYGFVSPPAGASPGDVWIRFTKPGSYTVRLGGHSTFGSWARQIAEQIVRFDDLNGNGILDFWEARYGGTDAAWAALDSDNDGRTNLEEWRAGTDPLVPDSAVSIVEVKDDIGGRQGSVANGGATDDPSPTLTGRLLAPLPVGSMIVVSDGNQTLGTANVSGLNWSFTPPPLVNGVHLLAAVLVQPSPALPISSPVWSISIGPDAPNAAAGGVSPTGVLETQCYREGTDVLIACGSAEAIALSGPGKQDGMRPGQFDFRVVGRSAGGSYDITDCVFDAITGLTWEGKPSGVGPRGADTSYTNFGDGQSGDAASYVTYVNSIALCGYRNWRLPTRQELAGLVDFGNTGSGTGNETTDPMINGTWFPNTKAGNHAYWTSTRSQQDDTGWIVRFGDGMVQRHSRLNAFFVRLVR